ncbi:hypothetical protein [Pyramidobacter porci]|uniref:hypothetical protein n=1 Tax=Pyramidobacter porci TaxID=2605789 RepID=UPI001E552846|nr:hypothetical protein [Pyramidobacter porci]
MQIDQEIDAGIDLLLDDVGQLLAQRAVRRAGKKRFRFLPSCGTTCLASTQNPKGLTNGSTIRLPCSTAGSSSSKKEPIVFGPHELAVVHAGSDNQCRPRGSAAEAQWRDCRRFVDGKTRLELLPLRAERKQFIHDISLM